jgi:site-specific DNA-adenine methylase
VKAPFPWFGGKRRVAAEVWAALGDVSNYVEPFAGSLAVLLERPETHTGVTETVNDADEYLANFWRALSQAPDEVAKYADWPVNESDLFARHLWLVSKGKQAMKDGLAADPEWYDPKIAGWWVWGICQWIGSGWCAADGPWIIQDGKPVKADDGVRRKLPRLGDPGQGIYRTELVEGVRRGRPALGNAGRGVNRQLPHLGDAGRGVNRKRPELGVPGKGVHRSHDQDLFAYMNQLADRLRNVRVTCGDWSRVVTTGALSYGSTVGIFLDPPYSDEAERDMTLYSMEDGKVAHDVREWAIANGDNPRYRIVLAGYNGEHDMPDTWRVHAWTGTAAYQNAENAGRNQENRTRERLWFSPNCLKPHKQGGLFDE